jgi:hypothetical protein
MQPDINYVDRSYSLKENKSYRLSIQVSLDGFSFCIYDTDKRKHVVLKNFLYSENIVDIDTWISEIDRIIEDIGNIPVIKTPVKCLCISPKNILIPEDIFSTKNIKQYLSFFFQLNELDEIQYKSISEIKAFCCFAFPSPIISKIVSHFGKSEFFNQAYQMICQAKSYNTGMNVMICSNFMDICIFKDCKFVLNNSFEVSDIKDIIYFISALSDKFNIRNTPIYMSGDISTEEIKILKQFFPSVIRKQDRKIFLQLGAEISTKYYNLLSLQECE